MKQVLPYFLFLLCSLLYLQVKAKGSKLTSEKEPAWITINSVDYNNKKFDSDAEDGYIDLRYEKQVSLEQQSRFYKKTIKILSEAGVQNSSEISINFDPAYEQLILHRISIIRDGKSIDKLQLSKFKTIQQEKELNWHMYNGSLTALLVLDDIRKGDIIESSYTIKGFNPIFNNKYTDVYGFNFGAPIVSLYYKLIAPANRNISIKNRLTNIAPVISKIHNQTVYEWKATDIAALHLEKKTPEWYNPYNEVMVSDFHNWNEVSVWANTLFPRNIHISPALQKKINSIKESNATNEARTLASLRFVQDDIRYMGIEIGVSSHKPNDPNKVLAQRFGDCKDKSFLLVTMLNQMDIQANPVLINTTDKKAIKERLPSASVFDHCTVQATINGKLYWFDPTIPLQRGSIGDISYPDYQAGLVVNDATTNLSDIPSHEVGLSDIKEIFDIPDMSGLAHLKVVTKNTGFFADDARSYFNNSSVYEIKMKYKDFYASYFDKITADSLTYTSDDATGAFTTTEYYTIKDIWKTEGEAKKIPVYPYVISSIMTKPTDKNRTMPFSLAYPARYKEQLEVNMPEDWPLKSSEERVECPSFDLHATSESVGNKILLSYEYENLKDHVMPDEAPIFFTNYDYANTATSYQLSYKPSQQTSNRVSDSSLPRLGVFSKLYLLLGVITVITFLARRQKQNG